MPRTIFSTEPQLRGERVVLRPHTAADTGAMRPVPALVDPATCRCVGEVVLSPWDPGNHLCSFRTLVGPERAGQVDEGGTAVLRPEWTAAR